MQNYHWSTLRFEVYLCLSFSLSLPCFFFQTHKGKWNAFGQIFFKRPLEKKTERERESERNGTSWRPLFLTTCDLHVFYVFNLLKTQTNSVVWYTLENTFDIQKCRKLCKNQHKFRLATVFLFFCKLCKHIFWHSKEGKWFKEVAESYRFQFAVNLWHVSFILKLECLVDPNLNIRNL